MLLRANLAPSSLDRLSLYEVMSMNAALKTLDKKHMPSVSDEDWSQAEQLLAAATANDPSVRLH